MKVHDFTGNQSHHIIAAMRARGLATTYRRSLWVRITRLFRR